MNKYIEYFTNYVTKNYDMNNSLISLKYYHSLRVAYIMMILAYKMNMTDEDILLAFKLGLCHDLGRFYEVMRDGKFNNLKFDHGTYSNKVLYNDSFIKYMDVDEHLLFRKAIYNHNKRDITNDLTKREEVFVNLLRDADKIDILGIKNQRGMIDFDVVPSKNVINNYLNNKTIDLADIKGTTDASILYLSFIKDLYFYVSHDYAISNGYLNGLLNRIKVDESKEELFDSLVKKIEKKRGNLYVR